MKISTLMSYAQGYVGATKEIVEMEKAGLDVVWVPEAYSFDGVSAMGYIAAKTEKVTIERAIEVVLAVGSSEHGTAFVESTLGYDVTCEGLSWAGWKVFT